MTKYNGVKYLFKPILTLKFTFLCLSIIYYLTVKLALDSKSWKFLGVSSNPGRGWRGGGALDLGGLVPTGAVIHRLARTLPILYQAYLYWQYI